PSRGFAPPAQSHACFRIAARGHRASPRGKNAGLDPDQSPRLFMVDAVPKLRGRRAVRKLQHRADVPQEPPAPRMPLLRLFDSSAEAMPEVPRRIHVL